MAIQSFVDPLVENFFITGKLTKKVRWRNVAKIAKRKLDMLHYADQLQDLRSPPANRLEFLKGDLDGLFSIRVNDQWRIVFGWSVRGPIDVQILDYH